MSEVIQQADVTIVRLLPAYDSLDEERLEALSRLLLDLAAKSEQPKLLLDMRRTEFIGSRFIEIVFRVWKRATERGGQLVLAGVQPFCQSVLRAARVDDLFTIYVDYQRALDALAAE